jgi:hypothetical protein
MTRFKLQYNKGAAMMMFVIFVLFGGLTVVIGIVTPVVREFQIAKSTIDSKSAYFLSESGVEDAFYRVKHNRQISSTETIVLGSYTATTTITSVGSTEKDIVSLGDVYGNQRTITLVARTGVGTVFKYGSQSGQGGIVLKNNAGLYGSFYSDGNISGSNGSFITGDAYAANSAALVADQSNTTPSTPTNNITFANANSTQDVAQSFQLSDLGLINKVQLYIKKVGTPSNATVRIVSNSSGSPSSTTIASGTLNSNVVTSSYGWVDVSMSSNPQLLDNTTYWIVVDASTSSSNYYVIGGNTSYSSGAGKIGQYSGTWNATSPSGLDIYFGVYLGGLTSSINNVTIGTNGVGNAYANSITNSTIAGTAYCQTGTGNNKSCDTSRSNPPQENLPISDANITEWKTDAENGGTTSGNVTISSPTSLGPKKIVGNLIINDELTLTDTVWVTGDVTMSIGSTVKLDSSYGTTTGILIADGAITIANNVDFEDSGTSGSYIMILSTSVCDEDIVGNPCSSDAVHVQNNSDIVIAAAPYGAVAFSNNAGVKEVVANKIRLKQNATITYGTGLINIEFSSGPSGSYNISSWKETQ